MTANFTETERRLGAIVANSRRDTSKHAARMQDAWTRGFLNGHECSVCPRETMPEDLTDEERIRRAQGFRKAHFIRMRLKSARHRARRPA